MVAAGTPRADLPGSRIGHRQLSVRAAVDPGTGAAPSSGQDRGRWCCRGATQQSARTSPCAFPLGAFVCVTGVSGSGKSSLVNETLARAVTRKLGGLAPKPGPHESLRGTRQIDKIIEIDQSPIGRTPRSNPATYTGVFDEIRKVFAATRDAKQLGFRASRFSFNVKGGRCEACQGQGVTKIEMNFLPDLYVTCSECDGARFNRQTLQVTYRDHSIADVLDMSIAEAAGFFENIAAITRRAAEPGPGRIGLPATGTALHNALRRRSTTSQTGHPAGARRHRQDTLLAR